MLFTFRGLNSLSPRRNTKAEDRKTTELQYRAGTKRFCLRGLGPEGEGGLDFVENHLLSFLLPETVLSLNKAVGVGKTL